MDDLFARTRLLLGQDGLDRLAAARVAVFGVGGVGGYVVEALARSGVGALDLIDSDTVDATNLNRQIIATVDASETRINVRWPAAWRLLARSQPIIAAKTTDTATRSSTEYRFNSVDQPPSRLAMGSFIFMDGCLLSICRP